MTDKTNQPAGEGQQAPSEGLSEEQARQYVERLRAAPAAEIVSDVLFSLLNAAQVKLGRADGRLFIDLSATLLERTREELSGDLVNQVDQLLGQLRLGQVQAESELARKPQAEPSGPDHGAGAEPSDGAQPTEPSDGAQPTEPSDGAQPTEPSSASGPAGQSQPPPASRLWVPGRNM